MTAHVPARVDICVATYRRPDDLRALLDSLARADHGGHRVRVLLVDNDPDAPPGPGPDCGLEIVRVVEPEPGIPAARNRALDLVDADWIAFVDDDEVVAADWLLRHLSAAAEYAAEVTTGPVISDLPADAPGWVVKGRFHQRRRFPTGPYAGLPATNNTLVSATLWDRAGRPRFDRSFTESGGSDTEFFTRLTADGPTVVWVDEAVVHETVPLHRCTARWLWRRYRRAGNVVARIQNAPRLRTAATGAARIGWGAALVVSAPVRGESPARGAEQLGRGVGAVQAAFGSRVAEYRRGVAIPVRTVPAPAGRVPSLVSVVIPVRNGMATLPEQLAALAGQTYAGRFEVILSDNFSTDGLSVETVLQVCPPAADLDLRVVPARGRPGVSHARNAGLAAARGDLILICDADDRVAPEWMADLVAAAADADLVGGSMDTTELNSPVVRAWRQLVPPGDLTGKLSFLPFARGANLAVWRDVALALGGWDEELVAGGDDVDFSWRAQLAGYTLAAATGGLVHYRLNPSLKGMATQVYRYRRSDALLMKRFAAHGAKADSLGRWVKNLGWLVLALPTLRTAEGRGKYVYRGAQLMGKIAGSVTYRVRT